MLPLAARPRLLELDLLQQHLTRKHLVLTSLRR
jgi:hypothetical protein